MKKIITTILLLLVSFSFSQEIENNIIYLDSLYNPTTKTDYAYYRIFSTLNTETNTYTVKDYYRTKVLYMEATSKSNTYLSREGLCTYYYPNGNKRSESFFKNSFEEGNYTSWYDDGTKNIEGIYTFNKDKRISTLTIINCWDKNGKQTAINGNGWCNVTEYETKTYYTGNIKNNKKEGLWCGTSEHFNITFLETYKENKLIDGESIDKNGATYQYKEIFVTAKPEKGYDDFYKYIAKNFNLEVTKKEISGKILVKFTIDKTGAVYNLIILKSLNQDLDNEAIRLIQNYPYWKPSIFRGKIVKTSFVIPITIQKPEE